MATATETKQRDITAKIDNGILTITFANGRGITIKPADMPVDIQDMAMLHGFKQKIVDAAALSSGATIEQKYEACAEVYDRLTGGEWNKRRESGEPRGGLLFNALCRAYPNRKPEDIRTFLDGKTRTEQNALLQNSRLREHVDAIRAEMARGIDADDLLNELED